MSVISALFNRVTQNYADAFRAADRTSEAMRRAIDDWFNLYYVDTPSNDEDPCQQIAYTIVRKLAKTTFSEYGATSEDDYVLKVLESLDEKKHEAVEQGLIGGECLLKPIPVGKKGWRWMVIPRTNVLVFARNAVGDMIDIGTTEETSDDRYYYTLLERRKVDDNGFLTITNKLYRSKTKGVLGTQVSLSSVDSYAQLPESYTFQRPIGSIGLVRIKTPIANCVDGSQDGVSVYAAAVGLIHNINRNEAQLNTEFNNGKSKVFVSADLTKRDKKTGKRTFEGDVFVGLDGDPEDIGVKTFSPALREASFLARKQEYLRNVESVIGLKRGLLSEVEAAERTAKEITSSEGEYNLTVIDFQQMWAKAVYEAVRLCGVLGTLYKVEGAREVSAPKETVVFDWGNGVLFDEEKTWKDYLDMVAAGMLRPEYALGWKFGMPTNDEKELEAIRAKYMPVVSDMVADLPAESGALSTGAQQKATEKVEQAVGKSLNGAQTQSLMAVIAQYTSGQLSIGQAVNIVSISIGVTKAEAQAIIEGAVE